MLLHLFGFGSFRVGLVSHGLTLPVMMQLQLLVACALRRWRWTARSCSLTLCPEVSIISYCILVWFGSFRFGFSRDGFAIVSCLCSPSGGGGQLAVAA